MMRAIFVFRGLAGLMWLVQLVLGILFWTGHALGLTQLHMGLGVAFVVALWVLAILCARAGAPRGLVVSTLIWGAIVAGLGYSQMQILPGPYHWTVRVVHLLVGIAAMGLAGRMSLSVRAAGSSGHTPHLPNMPAPQHGRG